MQERLVSVIDDLDNYEQTLTQILQSLGKIIIYYSKKEDKNYLNEFASTLLLYSYTIFTGLNIEEDEENEI